MLSIAKRYQTLLMFGVLVGCSSLYVACGSDDEAKPAASKKDSGTGGTGGTGAVGGSGGTGAVGGSGGTGAVGGSGGSGGLTGGTGGEATDGPETGDAELDAMDDASGD